jgi:AraC family transcriptional regulator, transcriptional activator of the genes for pyochelin and ferripyochelin receptors
MPLFISAKEAALKHAKANLIKDYEVRVIDPTHQSRGYRRSIDLPSGINLLIDQYDLAEDLFVEAESGNENACLELSFMVSGDNYSERISAGKNFIQSYFDEYNPDNVFYWKAGKHILKVDIELDLHFYQSQREESLEWLPRSLHQYLETDNIAFLNYFRIGQNTPEIQMVLHQVIDCPFAGLIGQIYLEAKCLELIALRLEPTSAGEKELINSRSLKVAELDRIYHAKEILLRHYDHPPSLLELARQVDLNDYKLKTGFRQIFGTTVFGYLWAYRMEEARYLLYTSAITVQEVAFEVGYTCHGRFSAAFKKRFGMTPIAYRAWRNGL